VTDKESGIQTIRYKVIDATDESLLWSGEIAGQEVVHVMPAGMCKNLQSYRKNWALLIFVHMCICWLLVVC